MEALAISGGFDSGCLWHALGKPPCIHVAGCNAPAAAELRALERMCEIDATFRRRLFIVRLDTSHFMRAGHPRVIAREQLIGMLAWSHYYDGIAYGYTLEDGVHDEWCERLRAKVQAAAVPMSAKPPDEPFRVLFPAAGLTKQQLYDVAVDKGMPRRFAEATHSCVRSEIPCGECRNCIERRGLVI